LRRPGRIAHPVQGIAKFTQQARIDVVGLEQAVQRA
jgi:hypothetical protein